MTKIPATPASLPASTRVVLDERVSSWPHGRLLGGGSSSRVGALHPKSVSFARKLKAHGSQGVVPGDDVERLVADQLIERGIVHP